MKKTIFGLFALLMATLVFYACVDSENGGTKDSGMFEFTLNFEESQGGAQPRASTALPPTSWSNINQIQFLLYDSSNKVCFSAVVNPPSSGSTPQTYTYTNVPVGTYSLVAVANAKSSADAVDTYGTSGATQQEWTEGNVFNKSAANLLIKHKATTWPASYSSAITTVLSGLTPYSVPAEVFMGSVTGVTITNGGSTTAAISLKREVSMMRVRVDNTTHTEGSNVDFTVANAGVLVYRLPDQMSILAGTTGGISTTSTVADALSAPGAFSATDPTGYGGTPGTVIEGNFKHWRDVVVFPNNGGRTNDATPSLDATAAQKYFFVLCGVAKAGHIYSDGSSANAGDLVFWHGQINGRFTPNVIREVDVTVKTGGSPIPPPTVTEYGELIINVSSPMDWNSNIVTSSIDV